MIVVRQTARRPEQARQELEQAFRALMPLRTTGAASRNGCWRPALEVYEAGDALVITAEIAGVDPASLDVQAHGETVVIAGTRANRRDDGPRTYREAGIAYGRFSAEVQVPWPADFDAAAATYTDGLLRIRIPRQPSRRIVPTYVAATSTERTSPERTNDE